MVFLANLWLPVLLSAAFVFIVSSIIHMVIPIHGGDFKKLSREDKVLEEMRAQGIKPGDYMFPFPGSMKEMGSPEMQEKYGLGPVGFLTVVPDGVPAIGKSLVQWFLYSILISIFTAYIAALVLACGAEAMMVFRVTGAIAVLGYAFSNVQNSIWKGQSWVVTLKFMLDGVVYGVVTGGTFAWLWPEAG